MQFIKHNFFQNFHNAVKFEDNACVKDLVIDEIAKLIAFDKNAVIQAVLKSGINLKKMPNNKQLASIVVNNIGKNESLRTNIIALIFANNQSKANADEKVDKKKVEEQLQNLTKGIDASLVLSFDGDNTKVDKELTEKITNHTKTKQAMETTYDAKKILYTYGGMAVFGIAVAYLMSRYVIKKMGSGGDVPPVTEPIATDVPPVQPMAVPPVTPMAMPPVQQMPTQPMAQPSFPAPNLAM